jgi:hypothetical protein
VGRILKQELKEEAIHLRFRQRIGAFHLDRILRRQHHERMLQAMQLAAHGDTLLLHRFQQRRLCLGRGAIDFIGQNDIGEYRTALKLENLSPRGIVGEHVGAGNVRRHEIGGELDPRETKTQDLTETAHHQGFAQARHAFEQTVAAADQCDEDLLDQLLVADDCPRHLRFQFVEGTARPRHALFDLRYGFHNSSFPPPTRGRFTELEYWSNEVVE